MSSALFANVPLAPRDPILGLNELYAADPRPQKANLGVGVYYDEEGRLPLLEAVREAERARVAAATPRGYLPMEGLAAYDAAVQTLLFGAGSALPPSGRALTAQALGGTGALKIGADLLKRTAPAAAVYISDPSWENHRALFENAGFEVRTYPYYDPATHALDGDAMLAALRQASAGSIVVLHACCHNPTGVDPTPGQWEQIVAVCRSGELVPFLDIAYQGFGIGIEEDAAAVRLFAEAGIPFLVASSFSKSFSLYGERVGALTVVTGDREEASRVLSQLKRVIRTNYSNPPLHGGSVVAAVLGDPRLRALWERDLAGMRERIRQMRAAFVDGLKRRGIAQDFSFIARQRGMFSYSGLTPQQVERLRTEHAVYAVSSGRICMAALNSRNIEAVCDAVAAVLHD